MEIICLPVGSLQTNCYLITDEETRQTLIIDPGDEADFISTTILEKRLIPQAILLTHGHYDHCLGVLELKLNFQIPIYLHQADLFLYQRSQSTAEHFSNIKIPRLPPIDFYFSDNQIITFGNSSLQVIHTPGHTPGSVCFLSDSHLFTGDTFFATGIGSTNHKYSSKSDLQNSLKKLSDICNLRPEISVYPGHEDYGIPLWSTHFLPSF